MPPKKMSTAAASSVAPSVVNLRANSSKTSATPLHVHSGTAQFNTAGPNHLPASPGTM